MVPPIAESDDREGREIGREKRVVKGGSVDCRGDASGKKKEVMRAYSLVRNQRVGKGEILIREF
jgi:hypothetical protein